MVLLRTILYTISLLGDHPREEATRHPLDQLGIQDNMSETDNPPHKGGYGSLFSDVFQLCGASSCLFTGQLNDLGCTQ